ncbi:MAG: hypothetical protein ACRD1O_12560 [Terriglobia bacterium]
MAKIGDSVCHSARDCDFVPSEAIGFDCNVVNERLDKTPGLIQRRVIIASYVFVPRIGHVPQDGGFVRETGLANKSSE